MKDKKNKEIKKENGKKNEPSKMWSTSISCKTHLLSSLKKTPKNNNLCIALGQESYLT